MQDISGTPKEPDTGNRRRHIVRGLGSLTIQSVLSAVPGFILFFSLVRFLPQ